MDNYFRTISQDTPRTQDGGYDLESPLCMDMELLNEHFSALNEGKEIRIPYYDFARKMRDTSRCTSMRLGPDEVVVFEGIHALNDSLGGKHPEAFKIYLSARSNILDGSDVVFKGTWLRAHPPLCPGHELPGQRRASDLRPVGQRAAGRKAVYLPL